jgi:transposase
MGTAYSVDLRRKVVQACERGTASQAQVARFFGVSQAFVEKLLRLYRRTGALEPNRKRAGRPGCSMRQPANRCSAGWPSKTT